LDFDVAERLAAVLGEVLGRAFVVLFATVVLVTDFFFLLVEAVVAFCGDVAPAHAPIARAANKATGTGTTMSCKKPVYTEPAEQRYGLLHRK
jgi:hypothetical protein